MLFNLNHFIKSQSNNPGRQDIFNRYTSIVEPIENITTIRDLKPYKEFVSKIETFPFAIPVEIKEKYDWEILLQLIMASSSSKADIRWNNLFVLPDLLTTLNHPTNTNGNEVSKHMPISGLRSSQVHRLFEIYLEELLEKEILRYGKKIRKEEIEKERDLRIILSKELKLKADKLRILFNLLGTVEDSTL